MTTFGSMVQLWAVGDFLDVVYNGTGVGGRSGSDAINSSEDAGLHLEVHGDVVAQALSTGAFVIGCCVLVKNERKTFIFIQLKISRYNPHFFAIFRRILRN